MNVLYPHTLGLLLLILFIFFLFERKRRGERALLEQFSGKIKGEKNLNNKRRFLSDLCLCLGFIFVSLALLRPVGEGKPIESQTKGRNIVFIVDVSRSMLAQDLVPNRLERAKYDILNSISSFKGSQVGLIAFAGNSVLKCPLTLDYSYFGQAVKALSPNSVSKGGTNLGDPIRQALDILFDEDDRQAMDLILITDGDDQGSFPVEAASKAGQMGICLITIGLGDTNKKTPVPGEEGKKFMTYDNQTVYSTPDLKTLQAMAKASKGGQSLSISSGTLPISSLIQKLTTLGKKIDTGSTTKMVYKEYYQIFLLIGIVLLLLGYLMGSPFQFYKRGLTSIIKNKKRGEENE